MRKGNYIDPKEQTIRRGYWLIRSRDDARFYISEDINLAALERTCQGVLNDKTGYEYWIDYCIGYDVNGRAAWSNLDHTDSFI